MLYFILNERAVDAPSTAGGGDGEGVGHGDGGRGAVVRRADPFSVNPGPRPGLEIGVGMHRKAVPL